ncbi:DUF4129 domain-containing protein [Brevibacillus invocatus]|uniref:DUF4129 domain-containing protein n=1 Tax=Brevibacillus invocatus TaxID=173959 RepID=UPI002041C107|nr:DUF4129 domain-containing protein [Brevibacillus invocatus]MCM3079863.1 DUF4129 domain-containing protein [Brevibacillus invocatus]MCM3430056.1 DUF4129 domain-containing protein [Brevibacillus invocatus]
MSSAMIGSKDKERLVEILSSDEFNRQSQEGAGWIEKAINHLIEMIAKLFQVTEIPTEAAGTVSVSVVIVAIGGLLFLIYWLSRKMVLQQKRERTLFVQGEKIRSYSDYLNEARQLGQQAEWREAVRHLFLALLVYLQWKKWIRIEKWKTNWEYADEIQYNYPAAQDLFRRHARSFEQVWYGQEEIDQQLFWQQLQELEKLLGEEGHRHG